MTDKPTIPYKAPDGVVGRPQDIERKINEAAAIIFKDDLGQFFIEYLESITLNFVHGPGVETNSLIHLEGQRYLVSVIKNRINHGKLKLPKKLKTEDK